MPSIEILYGKLLSKVIYENVAFLFFVLIIFTGCVKSDFNQKTGVIMEDDFELLEKIYKENNLSTDRIIRLKNYPIKVSVVFNGYTPEVAEEYVNHITNALLAWENKTNKLVAFVNTENFDKADIIINGQIGPLRDTPNAARTNICRKNGEYYAYIRIAFLSKLNNTIKKVAYPENLVKHEIGHALGLLYESDNPKSIMFQKAQSTEILNRDIRTLRKIYRKEPIDKIPDDLIAELCRDKLPYDLAQ